MEAKWENIHLQAMNGEEWKKWIAQCLSLEGLRSKVFKIIKSNRKLHRADLFDDV